MALALSAVHHGWTPTASADCCLESSAGRSDLNLRFANPLHLGFYTDGQIRTVAAASYRVTAWITVGGVVATRPTAPSGHAGTAWSRLRLLTTRYQRAKVSRAMSRTGRRAVLNVRAVATTDAGSMTLIHLRWFVLSR